MMSKLLIVIAAAVASVVSFADGRMAGYVVVTDFVASDGKVDVADALQKVIDDHPNRTIYFPDGTYILSHSIATPAHPKRSVDLRLSNYAVIKASDNWTEKAALVRLGGKDPANDIYTIGSNYGLTGGIIDGSGKADGISIDGGRESKIEDVSIKHTRIGVHIKRGANSGSSDADIMHVNIVGNKALDSIGLLVEGYDNTFSNMRIANVHVGVELRSGGNSLRNIHPLYTNWSSKDYEDSVGFVEHIASNWYSFCYSDNFATGFYQKNQGHSQFDSCFCMWYSPKGERHLVYRTTGKFNSTINDMKVGFHGKALTNTFALIGEAGGKGVINRIHGNMHLVKDKAHEAYLR